MWFRGREVKYAYYPTDIGERESTKDTSVIPELSKSSTDSKNQPLAKVRKKLKKKSKTLVSNYYRENMPLAKIKQRL